MKTVVLTVVETTAALRYLRATREALRIDTVRLKDRLATHGDGMTREALILLDAEIGILDRVIEALWRGID